MDRFYISSSVMGFIGCLSGLWFYQPSLLTQQPAGLLLFCTTFLLIGLHEVRMAILEKAAP